MIIKAISLYEPWATAMRLRLKRNETRPRSTNYRGWLAIQSAKKVFDSSIYNPQWVSYVQAVMSTQLFPYGMITCIVQLDSCIPTRQYVVEALDKHERQWGDYGPERYVLETSRLIVLPSPVPCRGRNTMLFDWELPKELEHLLG